MTESGRAINIFFLCCLIVLTVPVLIYAMIFGGVPSVSPVEARKMLTDNQTRSVLFDVSQPEAFGQEHINGALNLPLDEILWLSSDSPFFRKYEGQTLLFVCSGGLSSARAVKSIMRHSTQPVFNISGGMQKWPEGAFGRHDPYFSRVLKNGPPQPFSENHASMAVQLAACAAAFAIKPLYMLLSLFLIILLRKTDSISGKALRFSMICFLAGESFCALNYLFFGEDSYLIEYLHIAGMVAAFGFVFFAALQFIDMNLMYMSEKKSKCAAINLCGACYKYTAAPCRFTQIFSFACLSLMICGAMPLLANTQMDSYNTEILGAMYNYTHPVIFQYFEIRFVPTTAMIFFGLAFLIYWKKDFTPAPAAVILFSIGAGMLTFSYFRLFLFAVYADNLWWYIIWEEITELLFITGICLLIWVFKERSHFFISRIDQKTPEL